MMQKSKPNTEKCGFLHPKSKIFAKKFAGIKKTAYLCTRKKVADDNLRLEVWVSG